MEFKQYDIVQFDISQCIKDEEQDPDILEAVIVSPDDMNEVLRTVLVAPLCKRCAPCPTRFKVTEDYLIRLDQISSINKNLSLSKIGHLESSAVPKIRQTIAEMLTR